mgnify:CR=1 FL=1
MIINCINCKKKFEVNSSLISESGRTIQCGSCNFTWFYKPEIDVLKDVDNSKIIKPIPVENKKIIEKNFSDNLKRTLINNSELNDKLINQKIEKKNDNSFSIIKSFSYIVVLILSFIAVIIVMDTFKFPLSKIIPDLEIFLYNLYETIKDIYLFLKNLFN